MPRNPEPLAEVSGSSRRAGHGPSAAQPIGGTPDRRPQPDILLRLLSLLGARQAVQTCVLSREWRDLWKDVPRLHVSMDEFEVHGTDYEDYDDRILLFNKFVDCLLKHRNPVALVGFRLSYTLRIETETYIVPAARWIGHALLHKARSVEVFLTADRLVLDHVVFTSKHLTSLSFNSVVLVDGLFSQIQSECQVLERLVLQNCAILGTEISTQTLKFLSIGHGCFFTSHGAAVQTSISAPSLTHFGFFDLPYESCNRIPLLKNMESLETAYIWLGHGWKRVKVNDIHQLLVGLSGVTTLELYYEGKEVCSFI